MVQQDEQELPSGVAVEAASGGAAAVDHSSRGSSKQRPSSRAAAAAAGGYGSRRMSKSACERSTNPRRPLELSSIFGRVNDMHKEHHVT